MAPLAAAAVVVLRLPLLLRPATPDEAGFLLVASQWHVDGTSLYGNYWVDRPPLLIGIFRVADLLGGLTALRLIGALFAAATVLFLASTARRAFGARAATWTAVVAAGLMVSPLVGAEAINGELLAVPFIALGIRLAVEAASTDNPLAARGAALATGVAAVFALLVKQNMADVLVFAAVCWLVAWRTRRISGRACADLFALAAVGGVVGYAAVMLWAMAHGTSPLAVYEATYPFRIKAGHNIAALPGDRAEIRLGRLALGALLSGGPLLFAAFLGVAVRRTRQAPVVWAIVAAAAFATASILAGGSYWLHYLAQATPAVSLAAGALTLQAVRVTRVLAALVAASAVAAQLAVVDSPLPAPGNTVARALAGSARPGDTVLSAFGDADIPRSSGMSSPYPYLWSLPSRTLDSDLTLLRGILAGPSAPTWVVIRDSKWRRLRRHGVAALIRNRYRQVGEVCGRPIYLQRGIQRPPLHVQGQCRGLQLP